MSDDAMDDRLRAAAAGWRPPATPPLRDFTRDLGHRRSRRATVAVLAVAASVAVVALAVALSFGPAGRRPAGDAARGPAQLSRADTALALSTAHDLADATMPAGAHPDGGWPSNVATVSALRVTDPARLARLVNRSHAHLPVLVVRLTGRFDATSMIRGPAGAHEIGPRSTITAVVDTGSGGWTDTAVDDGPVAPLPGDILFRR